MNQSGKSPWWVVFGALLGLMVGNGPIDRKSTRLNSSH